MPLDRGTMSRYVEPAGDTLGATIVAAMWLDALANGQVISTDATGALVQPAPSKDGRAQACKKGHFFTAVVDCDAVLFDYAEHYTSDYGRGEPLLFSENAFSALPFLIGAAVAFDALRIVSALLEVLHLAASETFPYVFDGIP